MSATSKGLTPEQKGDYSSQKGKIKMTGLFNGFMDSLNQDSEKAKELCEAVGYWVQNSEEFKIYLESQNLAREKALSLALEDLLLAVANKEDSKILLTAIQVAQQLLKP